MVRRVIKNIIKISIMIVSYYTMYLPQKLSTHIRTNKKMLKLVQFIVKLPHLSAYHPKKMKEFSINY